MTLSEYARKRNFVRTREPGNTGRKVRVERPIFVVQLHHASHRHYDFRLQVGDALRSWAVPKGPSFDPAVKRLAAEVEDHPVAYASFQGEIAEGQYGAGHVAIFDSGIWSTDDDAEAQLRQGHLRFELFGTKLKGGWHLIRTRGTSRKPQWLLVKDQDRYAGKREADDMLDALPRPTAGASAKRVPERRKVAAGGSNSAPPLARKRTVDWKASARVLPAAKPGKLPATALKPQLATLVTTPPEGPQWLHEIKWDGYRITAMIRSGRVSLWSRNGLDWTGKLPDIVAALEWLGLTSACFDGELIAGKGGRADFPALQATLSGKQAAALTYVMFDVLHLEGISLPACSLRDRKTLLARLLTTPPKHLALSTHIESDGANAFKLATEQGFEGIVSKRADAAFREGRGGDWCKCKQLDSEEFAVVGVTAPKGSRRGIGALLLARHDAEQGWLYAGKIGSGLSDTDLDRLVRHIGEVSQTKPTVKVPKNDTDLRSARWFAPLFVVEVHSRGRGSNGLLRQPSVKKLRLDKNVIDLMKSSRNANGANPRKTASAERPVYSLTHPERVVFPADGITKQHVADYYATVMPQLLPGIIDRPLSLLRCPGGIAAHCFFQKHHIGGADGLDSVSIKEKSGGRDDYLVVRDAASVMQLVQLNALEFHPWGARAGAVDKADLLVFDLDPGSGVPWSTVRNAAKKIRSLLGQLQLQSFVRTSGGKGLHVVVPLNPPADWSVAKPFTKAFAENIARMYPEKFVATATKSRRAGRIFIDYLRNGRGATSVASYSLRARSGAPVAMPVAWSELMRVASADAFTLANVPARLRRRRSDPWADCANVQQSLDHIAGAAASADGGKTASAAPKKKNGRRGRLPE